MSRLQPCFDFLHHAGRKALIPFLTAGYPRVEWTLPLMHTLVEAGSDVIELGVPFSDPSADGPVIQKAGDRALAQGVGMAQVLELVRGFRQSNAHTPVVLMGYANPIERYDLHHGPGAFVKHAAEAGVDGVIVVDYPPEECVEFSNRLRANGLDLIFLLAPTSTESRIQRIAALASGYVYYVSLKGVTGSGTLDTDAVARAMPAIRRHVRIPVGVGFGIRDADTAVKLAEVSDAVVIGSKLLQLIDQPTEKEACASAHAFLSDIRQALDHKAATNAATRTEV